MGIDQRQSVSFSFNTEDQDKVCSKVLLRALSTLFYKPFFCLFIRCRPPPIGSLVQGLLLDTTHNNSCVRACGAKRGGKWRR
jgi:hypothetical protein